ncbi:terminase small subunit [Paraclostridium bifermentans]|uniref:terminase small subunit n=1 Tax=Paraclostridium bifermentans TaxID=1490 RepID=UPI00290F49A8|nr:terminase small subunit [Paraclostridium bifermentans]MDU3337947.1 terminase small subunit [Paraclostridium bifermentans]
MAKVLKSVKETPLNDRQKQFCIEYLKDLNATQAYLRVYDGIEYNTAKVNGSTLLTNTNVKEYLNALIDEYKGNVDVEVGEIVKELKNIALDFDSRKSDKIKALELLGRWKQMFVDKKEIDLTGNVIEVTLED